MSIKAMMHVWQYSKQRGSALVVMLALADMANDDGECYPGKSKLATKCRMNVRNLTTILKNLECEGELFIMRRRAGSVNHSNVYHLLIQEEVVTPRSSGSDSQITRGSDLQITRVVTPRSPDPLFKQVLDPSENLSAPNLIVEILKKRGGIKQ